MANTPLNQVRFTISNVVDVVKARRRGLVVATEMGLHPAEANKIAVVISELGRNIEQYAGEGVITLTVYDKYVEIIAEDQGPGIPDVARVLAGGYTTSQGMGLGISGSKRLMDEFEIQSVVGKGTTIRALKRLR
ncbi:MAG TPA: anti-sigma regulatory factor [Chloroflexi bacterium]|nr:anti-sigma regulatory factor [Chloroflexota bacterium]